MAIDEIMVKRRLASILEECQFIEQLEKMTHDEFIGDGRNLRSSAKALENITQSIVDVSSHIIAQNNWGLPETYKQTIGLLETHKVIPKDLSENLKNLVSMRNILVHRYIDADYDILWSSLKRISSDARSYVSFLREYLNQK